MVGCAGFAGSSTARWPRPSGTPVPPGGRVDGLARNATATARQQMTIAEPNSWPTQGIEGTMELAFLGQLLDRSGPWASVYLDTSRATEDAAKRQELFRRAIQDQLRGQGADGPTRAAVEEKLAAEPVSGAPPGRALFATAGEVVLDLPLGHAPAAPETTWSGLPHLAPLLTLRGDDAACLVARIDRAGADLELRDGGAAVPLGTAEGRQWQGRGHRSIPADRYEWHYRHRGPHALALLPARAPSVTAERRRSPHRPGMEDHRNPQRPSTADHRARPRRPALPNIPAHDPYRPPPRHRPPRCDRRRLTRAHAGTPARRNPRGPAGTDGPARGRPSQPRTAADRPPPLTRSAGTPVPADRRRSRGGGREIPRPPAACAPGTCRSSPGRR